MTSLGGVVQFARRWQRGYANRVVKLAYVENENMLESVRQIIGRGLVRDNQEFAAW